MFRVANHAACGPLWAPYGPDIAEVFFLRHSESLGNAKGIYGGWEDAALSMKGEQQAVQAGEILPARLRAMFWNGMEWPSIWDSSGW